MVRLFASLVALCLLCAQAWAQASTTPQYCNSYKANNVTGSAAPGGGGNFNIIINSPTVGGIFICGYNLGPTGAPVTATLGYGTGAQGTFTSLTQGWILGSGTPTIPVWDNSSLFRGLYIPPGNALLLSLSTTSSLGYTVYFSYQQNR